MAIVGNARSFHKKFNYVVEIAGVAHAGFSKVSELSVETAESQYHEGGRVIPHKSPGRVTFADITLERGATVDRDLYKWFQDVVNVASGIGLPDAIYKRNFDIVQKDRDGATIQRWTVYSAWPKKFVAGDWDAASDDPLIESVTLAIDYWELSR
jgi:phage tail-like protein